MSENGVKDINMDSKSSVRSRDHSTDTLRTRRSHRSGSRDRRDGRHRERERRGSRERSHRDERDRERSRRDRDYDRDRRHREHDRDERDRRRRKRDEEVDEADGDRPRKRRDYDDRSPRRGDDRGHSRDRDRPPRDRGPRDDRPDRHHSRGARDDRPPYERERSHRPRSPPPPPRLSPPLEPGNEDPVVEEPNPEDSEARSVFVSQLAARLTARDLGYFFEDKLGDNTVLDARIVTDRLSRRSKGIGYVEFRNIDLVDKALGLSGTVVMGLPIKVQLTEAERNRTHAGDGSMNLPPGVRASAGSMQLYVGSLHFNLTESDIKQVFEPFGELEFVDLHKDPATGRSKGYCFVQYKRVEDARVALEQMDGFELAGRTLRVNTVHEKGNVKYAPQESLEDGGGGNLNAASRQALMQKLARIEPDHSPEPMARPNIQAMESRCVLLRNMFKPEEETEPEWDKDLADDVKGECESKYGKVERIKVVRDSAGDIYVKFDNVENARKAIDGLNGRWFGGMPITAAFVSDAIMQAHL